MHAGVPIGLIFLGVLVGYINGLKTKNKKKR